jgi:hypothetical protein
LTEIGGRRPPIFFHSRGGFRSPAVTIGRLLRELGMTAGVSRTIAAGCVGVNADDCRTLQKSGQALEAELQHFALCASACVFAVIGAKFRIIPPGARIGVHSGKSERPDFAGVHKAVSNAQLGRYFREMGIADSLVDIILAVPHERLRHLTRDEIAELGIDTSEFQQTHWAFMELPARTAGPSALKLMLDTNADKRKEHRTSAIQLSCAAAGQTGSTDVLSFNYFRGLGRDEIWTIRSIALVVDEHKLALPKGSLGRLEAVEPGRPFDIRSAAVDVYFLQDAAGTGRMEIVESDVMEPAKPPLITKLSTAGLPKALERLKKACG